jgi:hypothetical protein
VTIQTQRNAEGTIQATARFRNSSPAGPLSNVGLQAAVPKSQKLQLLSISSTDIGTGAEATQMMRVAGCKGVSLTFDMISLSMVDILTYLCVIASTAAFEDRVLAPHGGTGDGCSQLGGTVLIVGEG